jgi:hypothetical protein
MALATQGPGGDQGARLCRKLAAEDRKLPLPGEDDETANRQYTKEFALAEDRIRGQAHGLEYAEYFHYIGPGMEAIPPQPDLEDYIRKHSVALGARRSRRFSRRHEGARFATGAKISGGRRVTIFSPIRRERVGGNGEQPDGFPRVL